MADQCKLRQNVGLENMNMTSKYDVTNNAHQIQMTPICHWMNPQNENFLRTPLVLTHWASLKGDIPKRPGTQSGKRWTDGSSPGA